MSAAAALNALKSRVPHGFTFYRAQAWLTLAIATGAPCLLLTPDIMLSDPSTDFEGGQFALPENGSSDEGSGGSGYDRRWSSWWCGCQGHQCEFRRDNKCSKTGEHISNRGQGLGGGNAAVGSTNLVMRSYFHRTGSTYCRACLKWLPPRLRH
jgi:hypothetical protein